MKMIRVVGEIHGIVAVDPGPISEGMVRRAHIEATRLAPGLCCRGYDHFTVTGHICGHVPVARFAIVLPTTANVHEVELVVLAPTLLYF